MWNSLRERESFEWASSSEGLECVLPLYHLCNKIIFLIFLSYSCLFRLFDGSAYRKKSNSGLRISHGMSLRSTHAKRRKPREAGNEVRIIRRAKESNLAVVIHSCRTSALHVLPSVHAAAILSSVSSSLADTTPSPRLSSPLLVSPLISSPLLPSPLLSSPLLCLTLYQSHTTIAAASQQ